MVQSGTPSWPSVPAQECQCSVLGPGMSGPVACGAPAPCAFPEADGVTWLDDDPAEQAPAPSSAVTVSTAAVARPVRPLRPPARRTATREIDMPPIMPDRIRGPAPSGRGAVALLEGLPVLGHDDLGQFLDRGGPAVLVEGDLAALQQG